MDKEKALKILIANAYCIVSRLQCTECPMYKSEGECSSFSDDDLFQAAITLNKLSS